MNRLHLWSLGALLAIGGLIYFKVSEAPPRVRPVPTFTQAKSRMGLPLKNILQTPAPATSEVSLSAHRPADDRLRDEVAADPHSVPSSLLDFSVVVSGKMKEARKSYVYAEALFSEFGNCAVDGQEGMQNLAVRAYCLANARRLVSWYPGLSDRWQELSGQVGRHLLDLVDLTRR